MPLHLKAILTPVVGKFCDKCGSVGPAVELSFFSAAYSVTSGTVCIACLTTTETVVNVALTEELPPQQLRPKILRKQKRVSQEQEVDIAEELGARTQKASGSMAGYKGDGRKKGVLRFEAKYTKAESYLLKLDDLQKIASECHGKERPLLVLDFKDKHTGKLKDRFAVVPFDLAKEIFHGALHDR